MGPGVRGCVAGDREMVDASRAESSERGYGQDRERMCAWKCVSGCA
ncbi:MAG: hypothetical protein Q4C47_00595 [Planctomycetia bacterium]|nr:hypothetical protein [Planctomycetia bacterium]